MSHTHGHLSLPQTHPQGEPTAGFWWCLDALNAAKFRFLSGSLSAGFSPSAESLKALSLLLSPSHGRGIISKGSCDSDSPQGPSGILPSSQEGTDT